MYAQVGGLERGGPAGGMDASRPVLTAPAEEGASNDQPNTIAEHASARSLPHRREFLLAGLVGAGAMTGVAAGGIEIAAERHGPQGALLPEQAALFQVILRNSGATSETLRPLEGSLTDPLVRVLDNAGKL